MYKKLGHLLLVLIGIMLIHDSFQSYQIRQQLKQKGQPITGMLQSVTQRSV